MTDVLSLKKANCKNCHKCIRSCPVKSIRFSENQAKVIHEECILCGHCVVVCPQNAKKVRNDLTEVLGAIGEGRRVIATLAPAFISEFAVENAAEMERYLKQLGFFAVRETAEGAHIVKSEYERMIRDREKNIIISSCCYTVVSMIQKYYPAAIPLVADVLSPMLASAKKIKQEYPDAYVVFIGPCISKKEEAQKIPGYVDCVLTFEELGQWFEKREIHIEPREVNEPEGRVSRFFPKTGGIIQCMHTADTGYRYLAVDGVENCRRALDEIQQGGLDNCFIEMSACEGSCVNGPSSRHYQRSALAGRIRVDAYAKPDSHLEKDYGIKADFDLKRPIPNEFVHEPMPSEAALRSILARTGKTLPEHELNCGSCGYATCREKAKAVYNNKADITMCLPYLLENAESFSNNIFNVSPNGIIVVDRNLCIQRANGAACHLFGLQNWREMIGKMVFEIMDPSDFQTVLETGNDVIDKRLYLDEFGKYVELTIVADHDHNLLFGILKDITREWERQEKYRERRAQTIDITDKVVEKQMRIVQEIASLLGETTAETKVALSKIKNTVLSEDQ